MKYMKNTISRVYRWMVSDTLVTQRDFDEKTHRAAQGFTNFG